MAEETPPRYCSTCRHELKPEDLLFCPKCGTPFMYPPPAQAPTPEADRPVPPPPPQPGGGAPGEPAQEQPAQEQAAQEQAAQRGWGRRHPILTGGLGIVLFVFIIVVVSLRGGGGGGEEHKMSASGGTASTAGQIVFRRYLDLELTKSAIFTMYPNGSHIRQITHPPEGFRDGSPASSPDGTKVAFSRQAIDESTSRIMVLNTKTGDARQVVRRPTGVEGFDPAFSPDGHSLAFKRIDGIWIVGLDGSGLHQVTNEHPNRAVAFSDARPQFSPDGKMLVFERLRLEDDHSAVFVQSLDSSASPEDARQITPWEMGCEDGPEFSPDGNWVLFSCVPEGGSSNLYWVHPDGTGLDRLTGSGPAGEGVNAPDYFVDYVGSSFSPEFHDEGWGDIVAARYPAYGDEGNSDVYGMHIESGVGRVQNLTKSQTLDDAPSWGTPEGAQ